MRPEEPVPEPPATPHTVGGREPAGHHGVPEPRHRTGDPNAPGDPAGPREPGDPAAAGGPGDPPPVPGDQRTVERTFAFVDLAGFTALAEAHGDADAARAAGELIAIARSITSPEVQLVKSLGDAVMLAADDPARMLTALDALTEAYRPSGGAPALRAGLHHGPAVSADRDYFGRAVNLAARVAAVAGPGEAVLTPVIARPAVDQGRPLEPLGQRRLRNIPDPVELFLLRLHKGDQLSVDPVCRMQVDPAASAARISLNGRDHWFCSLECVRRFTVDPAVYA